MRKPAEEATNKFYDQAIITLLRQLEFNETLKPESPRPFAAHQDDAIVFVL
jgi:hypothetical protein